jgi:hypothetical protein
MSRTPSTNDDEIEKLRREWEMARREAAETLASDERDRVLRRLDQAVARERTRPVRRQQS